MKTLSIAILAFLFGMASPAMFDYVAGYSNGEENLNSEAARSDSTSLTKSSGRDPWSVAASRRSPADCLTFSSSPAQGQNPETVGRAPELPTQLAGSATSASEMSAPEPGDPLAELAELEPGPAELAAEQELARQDSKILAELERVSAEHPIDASTDVPPSYVELEEQRLELEAQIARESESTGDQAAPVELPE